jgi:hypothetical protein
MKHGTAWKEYLKKHILEAVDSEDYYEGNSRSDKINYLYERFMSETGKWRIPQVGMQEALDDWLRGLALHITFYNCEILDMYEKHFETEVKDEKTQDKIIEDYWPRLSMALIALFREEKLC